MNFSPSQRTTTTRNRRKSSLLTTAAAVPLLLLLLLLTAGCPAGGEMSLRAANHDPPPLAAQPYIVDGTPVGTGVYPAFVRTASDRSLCGGSLIHADIVLTAAHCQGSFNSGLYVGAVDTMNEMGVFRKIDQQRPHPGYSQLFLDFIGNDVLVLRLAEPIWDVDPVVLNSDPQVPTDWQLVTAIGMGLTKHEGNPSDELLETSFYTVPRDRCVEALKEFDNVIVGEDLLCAGFPDASESICQGDSGGPLFATTSEDNRRVQVGVSSFTDDCGSVVPDGFARVSTFYNWIQEQICDMSAYPPADCPPVNNTTSPTAVDVEVVFSHDDSSPETTWSIRDRTTDEIAYAGPQYIPQPNEQWTTNVRLEPGPYYFEVLDDYGDGLQGVTRTGYFFVRAGQVQLVPVTPGLFKNRLRIAFRVPTLEELNNEDSITLQPTPQPTVATPQPTLQPRNLTETPTFFPTVAKTEYPTASHPPSDIPSAVPTDSMAPSPSPEAEPSYSPSSQPTSPQPSAAPSQRPSVPPTITPSVAPSAPPTSSSQPTIGTDSPSATPTIMATTLEPTTPVPSTTAPSATAEASITKPSSPTASSTAPSTVPPSAEPVSVETKAPVPSPTDTPRRTPLDAVSAASTTTGRCRPLVLALYLLGFLLVD